MKFLSLRPAFTSVAMKLFLAQIVVAMSALVVNVFSARTLGPEVRGELALYMQIAYVANAISLLGRPRAYLRIGGDRSLDLATTHLDIRALSRTPLVISVLISVLAVALTRSGAIASLVLAVGFFTLIYSGVQQKTFRSAAIVSETATPYLISTVFGQILMLASAVMLTWFSVKNVAVWLLAYGLTVIFPYLILSLGITLRSDAEKSADWRLDEVRTLGLKLMPMSTAATFGSRIDRFLIPALANYAQLGIYTVVVTMTELIAWPVKNYTDSRVPQWARDISAGRFNMFREIVIVSILIVALSVAVGSVLGAVLVPLYGQDFAGGLELVWPLVLAAALHAWVHLGTNLSLAAGLTSTANAIPVVAMIASGGSYFFLIPTLGAMGAAWGLTFGYALGILVSVTGIVAINKSNR